MYVVTVTYSHYAIRMKQAVVSEEIEQTNLVEWLTDLGLKFTAIPNNTYTKYHSQKAKNHRTGLRAGFPDLVVLIPPDRSRDGEGYFLCIEMKRTKDSQTSQAQKDWHYAINGLGDLHVQAYICKGAREAQKVVENYMDTAILPTF